MFSNASYRSSFCSPKIPRACANDSSFEALPPLRSLITVKNAENYSYDKRARAPLKNSLPSTLDTKGFSSSLPSCVGVYAIDSGPLWPVVSMFLYAIDMEFTFCSTPSTKRAPSTSCAMSDPAASSYCPSSSCS